MGDKPIIFSAPMIRALMAGRKTQTRRVLKPQPTLPWGSASHAGKSWWTHDSLTGDVIETWRLRYAVGDRLYPAMALPSLNRNYCADIHGNIWSRAKDGETWGHMKGSPTSRGYLSVTPAHEGKYRTRLVHRLVAEAFHGPAPAGMDQARHLNGDQVYNAPENLDWGTYQDNRSDRTLHGKDGGELHHAAKLTETQVDDIRKSELSQRALSRIYGVTQSTIWSIKVGDHWQKNPKQVPPNMPRWASRLTLTVTDVRVHRLQEISEEDAWAEGCKQGDTWDSGEGFFPAEEPSQDGKGIIGWDCARDWYADLWNSLHGPDAWDANPWVVAVSFTVQHGNIDQIGGTHD